MKSLLFIVLLLASAVFNGFAQTPDSTRNPFTLSGYLETYYTYDFGEPQDHSRPAFVYSYNRHNEVNLNLGMIKANYAKDRVRANLALMAGTYANANLAAEPGVMKNVMEANAGVKLSKSADVWLDAGIFTSHIGFESAIGKDCWNLTRSIMADNSPYYESGVKVTYTSKNGRWVLSGLILNGWQRIYRVAGNNTPAFGHQLTFKPNSRITLNSSSFIGNDYPDDDPQMRYFHNFYGIFQLNNSVGLTVGFDAGMEKIGHVNKDYGVWYTPVVMVRVSPAPKFALAARGEYYSDQEGVIISSIGALHAFGYSLNLDYQLSENAMLRLEGRGMSSDEKIFIKGKSLDAQNFALTAALCVSF